MPTVNHFPATRSAILTEFGLLRSEATVIVRERAELLARLNATNAEADEIERAYIADMDAKEPLHAIVPDTTGKDWQVINGRLRQVPRADGRVIVSAPAEPEPTAAPDTDTFAGAMAVACKCAERCGGLCRVDLDGDPGPDYRVLVARGGDALAPDPVTACRAEACVRHGEMMRERMQTVENAYTNHLERGEC